MTDDTLTQLDERMKVASRLCLDSKLTGKDVLFVARLRFRLRSMGREVLLKSMTIVEWERLKWIVEEA